MAEARPREIVQQLTLCTAGVQWRSVSIRSVFTALGKSAFASLVLLVVSEALLRGAYGVRNSTVRYIPLPYSLGDDYGPMPPWLDRFHLLVHDDALLWRNVRSVERTYVDIFSPVWQESDRVGLLHRFLPTLPDQFRSNPRWTIRINSRGDRNGEVADQAQASTLRIACIGDSWTFGMNVDQDETYPSRLDAHLHEQWPGQKFEIMNFGVLGYSSLQGLRLLKQRVLGFHPNIVVIGFAMNDSDVAGYRDKDNVTGSGKPLVRLKEAAQTFESYKLLDYLALTVKFRPRTLADYLKQETGVRESGFVNYDELDPWTRVSPRDYEANMREMIRLARTAGAAVIMLDNELWGESPYRPVLRRVSNDLNVPLIDTYQIIEDARKEIERDLENRLNLASRPPVAQQTAPGVTVVFRVAAGATSVPSRLSIVGTDPQLGAVTPNVVAMHDDGTAGDQRAGDGVWSLSATLRPGTKVSYVYTNSGRPGRWEGLDLPHIRSIEVPAATDGKKAIYLPIDTFGRVYMQADNWHTDRVGYDLIARAVAKTVPLIAHP
jgi:lysophospholipase L1-like esterase